MRLLSGLPLFWRVCLTNGVVFVLGTFVLAVSPATVSERVVRSEVPVLVVGLAVIVAVNALLLRAVLHPLDRLTAVMARIDLREPGTRFEDAGGGPAAALATGFNAMLDRLEHERAASAGAALRAQETERQRIAQELHDEVGQSLTVVLLGLKRAVDASTPEVADTLRLVQDSARSSLDEVRRISQRLRPGVLEDLGLLSSLSSLASDFTTHTDVPVERRLGVGLPRLSPEADLVVYRVAQEALTNISRHARASAVELALTRHGDRLVLRVADDGHGCTGPEGSGIGGMRERALLVGGTLDIAPRPGGGTAVTLSIPLVAR